MKHVLGAFLAVNFAISNHSYFNLSTYGIQGHVVNAHGPDIRLDHSVYSAVYIPCSNKAGIFHVLGIGVVVLLAAMPLPFVIACPRLVNGLTIVAWSASRHSVHKDSSEFFTHR